MNEIYLILAVFTLFVWNTVLSFNLFRIVYKNRELFGRKKTGDIYELINSYLIKMREIDSKNDDLLKKIGEVAKNFEICFQKIGIVRYNPFGDIGGDQSFSLALLDKKDNGIVITSILSREGNRIYAKPIAGKKSTYHLSKEEMEALEQTDKKASEVTK
ncbi:MAG: DUF4446 family protein [Patescibacteria group bacterium]|nr:DUF4446 family protein [Patescibacteria group bacterium]